MLLIIVQPNVHNQIELEVESSLGEVWLVLREGSGYQIGYSYIYARTIDQIVSVDIS